MRLNKIKKIVSGGQTGADRAAWDFALENGFESGGFVPKNRLAEDGRIPDEYPNLKLGAEIRLGNKNLSGKI